MFHWGVSFLNCNSNTFGRYMFYKEYNLCMYLNCNMNYLGIMCICHRLKKCFEGRDTFFFLDLIHQQSVVHEYCIDDTPIMSIDNLLDIHNMSSCDPHNSFNFDLYSCTHNILFPNHLYILESKGICKYKHFAPNWILGYQDTHKNPQLHGETIDICMFFKSASL